MFIDVRKSRDGYYSLIIGEGWSDFFAILMNQKETNTRKDDIVVGSYVSNTPAGIRGTPYSTDMGRNPLTCNIF
jgi:hypothetical protein